MGVQPEVKDVYRTSTALSSPLNKEEQNSDCPVTNRSEVNFFAYFEALYREEGGMN